MNYKAYSRSYLWLGTCFIFIVFLLLYVPNLRTNPGWYADETYVVSNAAEVSKGHFTNFAIKNTFFHVTYPYQLPYTYICGIFFRAFHHDILGPRTFNILIGLAAALFAFHVGRRKFGLITAFSQALLILTYEQSVIHYRYTFAHNGTGLGLLVATIYLLNKSNFKNDLKAGVGILIAGACHPLVTHVAISSWLCRFKKPRSWIALGLPYAILLLFTLLIVYTKLGNTLAQDLTSHLNYYSHSSKENSSSFTTNVLFFFFQDPFHILALASLLLAFNKKYYPLAIMGLVPSLLLLQNRANLPVFYYQAMLVLPVFCLSIGQMFHAAAHLINRESKINIHKWTRFLPLILPVLFFTTNLPKSYMGTLTPRNVFWTTQSYQDVEAAAAWINVNTKPADLVICNPNIAWLLHTRTAHYLQTLAWRGYRTHGYELELPKNYFLFSPDLSDAKFAVVGDMDLRWTFGQLGADSIVRELQAGWPIVWQSSTYTILKNPKFN